MKLRAVILSALVAALAAPAAWAQGAGTVEFGLFARKNWFGKSYGIDNRAGGGARLAFFPIKYVSIEASGAYTPTQFSAATGKLTQTHLTGQLLFNIPLDPHVTWIIGGGATYNRYGTNRSLNSNLGHDKLSPGGLTGLRLGVGGNVAVRLDFTADRILGLDRTLSSNFADHWDWHYGFQGGLSFLMGGHQAPAVRDADGDGVPDSVDQCPNTPKGTPVNSVGCPIPTVDSAAIKAAKERADSIAAAERARADSIAAAAKARADSIAAAERARADSIAAAERARAQAVRDSAARAAGFTQAQLQALRDSLAKLTAANAEVTLPGVNFATGSARLTPNSRFILDEVVAALNDHADIKVEVQGHTDITGSRRTNMRLSQARAETVMNYLAGKGIAADRMTAKGYGPDHPVASNRTARGRALNRRVELVRTN